MNYLSSILPKKIFKGDQNLLWDGFLTDLAFQELLKKQYPDSQFIPFVHDEKIGAADVNLIYCRRDQTDSYFLSEDYADSAGDACYINIDGSYGLFYFPVVEEERLKQFGISIRAKSKQFIQMKPLLEKSFIEDCAKTGLLLDLSEPAIQTVGPMLNQDVLDCYFTVHPFQQLFYLFSKSHGRYGIVPREDKNKLLSSLSCKDNDFQLILKGFLQSIFFDSAVKFSDPAFTNSVKLRIVQLEEYLDRHEAWDGSYANWQIQVIRYMEDSLQVQKPLPYSRSSIIFQQPENYGLQNWMLHLLKENPTLFMECYNEALNVTRMSIQRLTVRDSMMNIPFYINQSKEEGIFYRTSLFMEVRTKKLYYLENNRWISLETSFKNSFITGKAIPFLNELLFFGKTMALPESGSKYTPACKVMINLLRKNGVKIPESNIIRIGLNFLDHLSIMQNYQINLPPILKPFFGDKLSATKFSSSWRSICKHIQTILDYTNQFEEDQQVRLVENWFSEKDSKSLSYMEPVLRLLLWNTFQSYKSARDKKQNKASDLSISEFRIEKWKLNLLVDFYKQRLVQVMDGLFYLNNRPYSLSVFLMFGPEYFWELIKYVTFREEKV